jgi:prepilin-type N-terminal cleavage/methylation domain-containing protein
VRRLAYRAPALLAGRVDGFSLIELTTVIVLMGILGAVAVPRLMDNDAQYRSMAEQLRSNLRYAERVSASRNRDVCVTVTVSTIMFRIAPSAGVGVACGGVALAPLSEASDTLDIVLPAGSPMSFTPAGTFRFTPSASLANNAGAAITTRTIAMRRGGVAFATFDIQRDNGYVLSINF